MILPCITVRRPVGILAPCALLLVLLSACQDPAAPTGAVHTTPSPEPPAPEMALSEVKAPPEKGADLIRGGVDLSSLISRSRHQVRSEAQGSWAVSDRFYEARHDGRGFSFVPEAPSRGEVFAPSLRWKTQSVRFGDLELLQKDPELKARGHEMSLVWDGVTEKYVHRDASVEQLWEIPEIAGKGPLVIRGELKGASLLGQNESGLHLGRKAGKPSDLQVRYSPATVFDAAGKSITVAPRWDERTHTVSLTVPEVWLAAATAPLVVDPTFSGEIGADNPVYEGSKAAQSGIGPEMAPGNTHALVVWVEDHAGSPSGSGVYASLVDDSGAASGGPIAIATGDHTYARPSVAFDGTNWLVVWADDADGTTTARAAIVDGTDQSITSVDIEQVAGVSSIDVAGDSGGGWVVAYEATGDGQDIKYATVSSSGTVGTPGTIAAESSDQKNPAVSSVGSRFVLVWENRASGSLQGQAFRAGTPRGTKRTFSTTGSPREPDASCYTGNQCVVVWHTENGLASSVEANRLGLNNNNLQDPASGVSATLATTTLSGAPQRPSVVVESGDVVVTYARDFLGSNNVTALTTNTSLVTQSGPTTLANSFQNENRPAVIYQGFNFISAWINESTGDIQGRTLNADHSTLGSLEILNQAANGQHNPAVARSNSRYLLVWEDERGASKDIYAARVDDTGAILDPAGLDIATGSADEDIPAVCTDGNNFLVIWREDGDQIKARSVSSGGGKGTIQSLGDLSADGGASVSYPDCTYAGGGSPNYLTAWLETSGSSTLKGRPVARDGESVGAGTTIVDSADNPVALAVTGVAGTAHVAWADNTGELNLRQVNSSGVAGLSQTVVSGSRTLYGLDVMALSGRVITVYSQDSGSGDGDVYAVSAQSNYGTAPKTPLAVADGSEDDRNPSLGVMSGGNLALGWDYAGANSNDIAGQAIVINTNGADPEGLDLSGTRYTVADSEHDETGTEIAGDGDRSAFFVYERFVTGGANAARARGEIVSFNQIPVAVAAGDTTGDEGSSFSFNGSGSTDGDGDTLTYAWDFGDGNSDTGEVVSHTFADDGVYTVVLTVDDGNGGTNQDSLSVTVNNLAPVLTLNNSTPSNEGAGASFTSSVSDPGGDSVSLSWDFGDGGDPVAGNTSVTYTFAQEGTYTVTLTATDDDGASTQRSIMHTVNNVAPVVDAGNNATIDEGDTYSFNANVVDPGDDTLVYNWVYGDGDNANNAGSSPNHTYSNDGTFTAAVTVDDGTDSAVDTVQITVNNVAPAVNLGGNQTIDEGDTVSLTANASDPGADVLAYHWNYGDNQTNTNGDDNVTHRYGQDGVYTVTVTVSDDDDSTQDSITVTVLNVAPVVDAGDNINGQEGSPVTFAAMAVDPGDDTLTYDWDYGDGDTGTNVGATPTHTYNAPGVYTATLTVDDGTASVTDQVIVTVGNAPPVVNPISGDDEGNEGDNFSFSTSASDTGQGQGELDFFWDFGDGNTETGEGFASVSHTYADDGNYTVTVTVLDGEGASTQETFDVVVNNVAPLGLAIGGDDSGGEGQSISFTGSANDPGDDTLTYSWTFNDGTNGNGASITHAFPDQGVYTVRMTVSDGDGGVSFVEKAITVTNVAPVIVADNVRSVGQGINTTFTASVTDVPTDVVNYLWTVVCNNSAANDCDTDNVVINGATGVVVDGEATVTVNFGDADLYDLVLDVNDQEGGTTEATTVVTVGNDIPLVTLNVQDNPINEGGAAAFTGTATDPSGIVSRFWDFGDGDSDNVNSDARTHIYVDDGDFAVRFSATDGDGASADASLNLRVNNVPPVVLLNNQTATESTPIALNVTVNDPGVMDIRQCTWDFGDGAETLTNDCAPVSHTYADDGAYILSVSAFDGDDTTVASSTVSVVNIAPTVLLQNQNSTEGATLTVTASAMDAGTADTLTYTWTFGDGSDPVVTSVPQVTHVYNDDGSYQLLLEVNDGTDVVQRPVTVTIANINPSVEAGNNRAVGEGVPITFSGSASDPGGAFDPLTYCWDFGDGTEVLCGVDLAEPTHTYADNDNYTVRLTVTDDDGGETIDSLTVTVNNTAPTVDAGDNITSNEGDVVSFEGTATDPGGQNDPLTYCWDFGEGGQEECGPNLTNLVHQYDQNGAYTVRLTVTDGDGGETIDELTVVVENVAPLVDAGNNIASDEGEMINFAGSATDPGDDALIYTWDFGDGSDPLIGEDLRNVDHIYIQQGRYTVRLTVDDGTTRVTDTLTVTVRNVPPSVEAGDDITINEGDRPQFAGAATDPGDDTLVYTWTFGDGSDEDGDNQLDPEHTFTDNGEYTVILSVFDGTSTVSDTLTVTVNNVAPTVEAGNPQRVDEGQEVTFEGEATDPAGDDDPLTFTWDFGDGSDPVSGINLTNPTHTFVDDKPGDVPDIYTVTLTVTDGDGGETSATVDISVDNVAPVVEAGENQETTEGALVRFSGEASDRGTDPLTYNWDFGDGTRPLSGIDLTEPTHTFTQDGNYTVVLVVVDADGGETTDTLRVEVANVDPEVFGNRVYSAEEGEDLTLSAIATDLGDDVLVYNWNFGDGDDTSGQDLSEVVHAWEDEGEYDAELVVNDGDGGQRRFPIEVTITNVAPSFGNQPEIFGAEGELYSFEAMVIDPGVNDTHEFALLDAPQGMDVGDTGIVTWTPSAQQALSAEPFPVHLRVTDNSGAFGDLNWSIRLNFLDSDEDGLPDDCEQACAPDLNPNVRNDPDGDLDGDGISNLDECLRDSNPCQSNGPNAPVVIGPANVLVERLPVELLVNNAFDPDGDELTYTFELYEEANMARPVYSVVGIMEGNGQTGIPIGGNDLNFEEDGVYFWRARASDGTAEGPFSELSEFRFSLVNQPPSVPVPVSPMRSTTEGRPVLTVNNAMDPEQEQVTYNFAVFTVQDQILNRITETTGVLAGNEQSMWRVDLDLEENQFYAWRAQAVDARGATSDWSDVVNFQVNTQNSIPEPPVLLLPSDGDVLDSGESMLFVAGESYDADGDLLTYEFELADSPNFEPIRILYTSEELNADSRGQVTWVLEDAELEENTMYWWRVRASDPQSTGAPAWRMLRFSSDNEAPTMPLIQSPADGESVTTLSPTFRWANSMDPEGDLFTYTLELFADASASEGSRIFAVEDIEPHGSPETTWQSSALRDNESYWWRIVAIDERGAVGEVSPLTRFFINQRNQAPMSPELLSPINNETLANGETIVLTWANAYDAEGNSLIYSLELYKTDGDRSRVDARNNLPEAVEAGASSLTLEDALPAGTYSWRVRASDGRDDSFWSDSFVFTVSVPEPNAELPDCDLYPEREECEMIVIEPEPAAFPEPLTECTQTPANTPAKGGVWWLVALGLVAGAIRRRR